MGTKVEQVVANIYETQVKQKNLKGIFIKEVLDMYAKGLCTEEEYQKAIEIGLEAM